MAYEEAVARVLEVAGDYKTITTNYNLEATLCTQICKTSREKVKQAIESLSLGDIHLSINGVDCLSATVDGWNVSKSLYSSIYNTFPHTRDLTVEVFKDKIEELLISTLALAASVRINDIESVSRFAGYAKLILLSINDDVVKTIAESLNTYATTSNDYRAKTASFTEYSNAVSVALRHLAHVWYKEKAVFAPGMKMGIYDFRTNSGFVKTIESYRNKDGHLAITFNDSSSILTDPTRVSVEMTWLLNDKNCGDIAKAIKWKPIADFT